ncbi:MAG: transposase [Thermoplasmataceae archaeon]
MNGDLRLPLISIPSSIGNDMPFEICGMLDSLIEIFDHIDMLLFDRGFYSKELMMNLNERRINYLIFVPKNPQVKDELSLMYQSEKKILLREFSMYKDGKRINDSVHLAFLKQIFDTQNSSIL